MKRWLSPGKLLLLAALVGIFSGVFHAAPFFSAIPWHFSYSDILPFYNVAAAPALPYLETTVEYPVLTGLFIRAMGFLGETQRGYYLATAAFLILAAITTTWILTRFGTSPEYLLRYWILAPSFFFFAVFNWDLLAVLVTVATLYAFRFKRWMLAAALIGVGFSIKLYPIIMLAPLLIKTAGATKRLQLLTVCLTSIVLVNLPFMISNINGWGYFFTFNSLRAPNPDSPWALPAILLGLPPSAVNIVSLILFIGIFGWVLTRHKNLPIGTLSAVGIIIFILTNKIFSPQYLLWLLPFFVLTLRPYLRWFYALELANLAVLFTVLPWLLSGAPLIFLAVATVFVVIRHVALIKIGLQSITETSKSTAVL